MLDFAWKAARPDGRMVDGVITAASRSRAIAQLHAQGLTVLQIDDAVQTGQSAQSAQATPQVSKAKTKAGASTSGKPVTAADILSLTSELSIMLKAGLPMDNGLRLLTGMNKKPSVGVLTQTILADVKGGATLSKALSSHPQHFNSFYVNMIRSGEASGQLSHALERLLEHLERMSALRHSVISATIYPCILLAVAVLSLVAMLGFVVPQFEALFKDMGDALPVATRIIMQAGNLMTGHALELLSILALLGVLGKYVWASEAGTRWRQKVALRLPVLGPLIFKYNLTLFARALGTLLNSGVPLVTALNIATLTVGNLQLRAGLESIVPHVKSGGKMADALDKTGIFQPLAVNLVKVGEETGRLGSMFLEVARIFNTDVETGVKRALTLIEPVLIIVLGVLIAGIIASILMGILSVNDLAV